jgi:hypothetical protein
LYSVVSFADSANGDDGVCCLSGSAWVVFDLFVCLILYCTRALLIRFLLLLFAQFELCFSPVMGESLFFAYPKKSHQKKRYPTCPPCGYPAMLE